MKIVPATINHINAMYDEPLKHSVKALAAVDGEEVYGVGGIYYAGQNAIAFIKIREGMKKFPKMLFRATLDFLNEYNGELLANCDSGIDSAERFLKHLGFNRVKGGIWARR